MLRVPEVGSGLASFTPRLLFPLVPCRASLQHPPSPVPRLHTPHPRPVQGRAGSRGKSAPGRSVPAVSRLPSGFVSLLCPLGSCGVSVQTPWGCGVTCWLGSSLSLLSFPSAAPASLIWGKEHQLASHQHPNASQSPFSRRTFGKLAFCLLLLTKPWPVGKFLPSGPGTQPLGLAFGDGAGRSWCWTPRLLSSLQVGKKPN